MQQSIVMTSSMAELCNVSDIAHKNPYVMCVQNFQLPIGIFAVYATYQVTNSTRFRQVFNIASPALRVLLNITKLAYFFGGFTTFVLYFYTMIRYNIYSGDCRTAWSVGECIAVRLPSYYCFFVVSLTHAALMIDRMLVTFCRKYYDGGKGTAMLYAAIIFSLSIISSVYVYGQEEYSKIIFACITSSALAREHLVQVMTTYFVIGIITAIGDGLVFAVCKKRFVNKVDYYNFYTLNKSVDIRENRLSIKVVLPLSIVHLAFTMPMIASFPLGSLFVWVDSTSILLYVETVSMVKNLYFLLSPIVLTCFYICFAKDVTDEWLDRKTNQAEEHFRQLHSTLQL
ncbi:unnamed protein product [Bursaphelenchus okinawaensis]|uniref:G_PROTEIN_RECEP_F1_2 domain-containing protein n=1 Tax=Bursaphelenchus okinawaensis TaxID=465554 RepID=A0A811LMY4_9BILA|nr:unnamed protein product [Bursaphelenchus okinawaensis]CAG9124518.1 unnamed protein product [Bursaphelenchus okinawaensis]